MTIAKILVFNSDDGTYGDVPPNDAVGFMAWFNRKLALIPTEYVESAEIELKAEEFYDSLRLLIRIFYRRPETDDEVKAREASEKYQ